MPLERSIPGKGPKKSAAATTTASEQVIPHRLRSQAAAEASEQGSAKSNRIGKERWTTTQSRPAREFGAALGKETFERVTGSYTPKGELSPAWDSNMDDLTVPFHRSTPSHELEDDQIDEVVDVQGVKSLSRRPAVRLDISAGNAAGAAAVTATTVTEVSSYDRLRFRNTTAIIAGQTTSVACTARDTTVMVDSTVSNCMSTAGVVSEARSMPLVSSTTHQSMNVPVTSTNPFVGQGAVSSVLSISSAAATGAESRLAEGLDLQRMTLSPIPSLFGTVPRRTAATTLTYVDKSLEGGARGQGSQERAATEVLVAKGHHLMEVYRMEFQPLNVNSFTPAMLQELCTEANNHKRSLARVEEKLISAPHVDRIRATFATTRAGFVDFISRAQRRICEAGPDWKTPRAPAAAAPAAVAPAAVAPTPQRGPSALSVSLKRDRVIAQEHRLIEEMMGVMEEAKAMQREAPEGDTHIRTLFEKCKGVKERAAELAKEALALYTDAADAELESAAKALYDCMQLMQATARDAYARLSDIKVNARIGIGGGAKDLDFPAPTFSGAADEDVYKFLDLFDQYVDARGFSDMAALRALRTVCIKGQLAITCADMEAVKEIRSYLLDVYGQPRVLLESRLKEVMKLGKCPTFPAEKRRDWMIRMQNQLNYLMKICRKFHLVDELMFSPVLGFVHENLPSRVHQDYLEGVGELPREQRTRRRLFNETITVIAKQVLQASADVNTNHVLGLKQAERVFPKKTANLVQLVESASDESEDSEAREVVVVQAKPKKAKPKKKPVEAAHPVIITVDYTDPKAVGCVACPGKHTHMFYCPEFQRAGMDDRVQIAKAQGACRRCLRSDSELDLSDRRAWFARHEANCKTEWTCKYEWTCGKASPGAQLHMLLCKRHARHNKDLEGQFIKSLDQNLIKQGVRFFFSNFAINPMPPPQQAAAASLVPSTPDQAIYMMQSVYNGAGEDLLMFYDSGCSVAAISERASIALGSRNLIPGPLELNVAGGQVVQNRGGLDEFELELFDDKGCVQMRGLVMETVTNPFARYSLLEAYEDLRREYGQGEGSALPLVPDEIGGSKVDVMVGIKYLAFFPELVFSLPSGLGIFESRFRSLCGRRGVIGGPHHSWAHATEQIEYMSAYAFLLAELRAYQAQASALDVGWQALGSGTCDQPWLDDDRDCGCWCHAGEAIFSLQENMREFNDAERIGF